MLISRETDYAYRIVLYLAQKELEHQNRTSMQVIAQDMEIPSRFAANILHKLIKAGIIQSFRGNCGGYALARPAKDITFLEVLEAAHGPLYINLCMKDAHLCNRNAAPHCIVHEKLSGLQQSLREQLSSLTFGD
jgi:Rrf2 family protein